MGSDNPNLKLKRLFQVIGFLDTHLPEFYADNGTLERLFEFDEYATWCGYLEGAIIALCESDSVLLSVFDSKINTFAEANVLDADEVKSIIASKIVESLNKTIDTTGEKVKDIRKQLKVNRRIFEKAVGEVDSAMKGKSSDVEASLAFDKISEIRESILGALEDLKYAKPMLDAAKNLKRRVIKAVWIES